MAMAGRCLPRLLAAAAASSRLRALPAVSHATQLPLAHDAPVRSGAATEPSSFVASEPHGDASFARLQLEKNATCLRISSFSIIDGDLIPVSNGHFFSSGNEALGLQLLAGEEIHGCKSIRRFSTKASPPPSDATVVTTATEEAEETKPKTLDDFQHEEIVGPTVERDSSRVADELRESLAVLQRRIVSFQKSLVVLGCVQGAGAVWCSVSWHAFNPTWQLPPAALLSFALAFVLRQALQPIAFFGKLEERSRLRIITLSLMIAKGFASFFSRARILVVISATGLLCVLLYNPATYLSGLVGILK